MIRLIPAFIIKAVIDHILNTTGSPYTVDELTRMKAGL